MIRLFFAWLFLALFFCLFLFAADGGRWMWLHLHWPIHRQRMKRAALCLEAAHHWGTEPFVVRRFISEAYRLCADCGCPADCWPVGVVQIHAGWEVR